MVKPNFVVASSQIANLFEREMTHEQIVKIANYVVDESRRGHNMILGQVPEFLSIYDILGCEFEGLRGNRDLEQHMDMPELEEIVHKSFERNKCETSNAMCCVYFKQKNPYYPPLFFIELCVPLKNNSLVLLSRRSDHIYVGKYYSYPDDVIEYNSVIKSLQENTNFLSYKSIANMRMHSWKIRTYLKDRWAKR